LLAEIHRHDFGTFVDEPPSVAQGGKGVIVPGPAVRLVQYERAEEKAHRLEQCYNPSN